MKIEQFKIINDRYLVMSRGTSDAEWIARDMTLETNVILQVFGAETWETVDKERVRILSSGCERYNLIGIIEHFDCEDAHVCVLPADQGKRLSSSDSASGSKMEKFSEEGLSDLLAALSYLHSEGIVYNGLNPDTVFVTDDGRLQLLGMTAPDTKPSDEDKYDSQDSVKGPWSDIYSLSVLCRNYANPDSAFMSAVQKGMQWLPGDRFMNCKAFTNYAGVSCETADALADATKVRWADSWIRATTEGAKKHRKAGKVKKKISRRQIITACIVLAVLIAGGASFGFYYYFNDDARIARGVESAVDVKNNSGLTLIYMDTLDYEYPTFNMDRDTAVDVLCTSIGRKTADFELESSSERGGEDDNYWNVQITDKNGKVREDVLVKDVLKAADGTKIDVTYDRELKLVTCVSLDSNKSDIKKVLTNAISSFVPEMYLTEKEVDKLIKNPEAYSSLYDKCEMTLLDIFGDFSIILTAAQIHGDDRQYAGNFTRGSEEQKEYIKFIKDNTVSEKDGKYMLDEEAVLEYGLPCNDGRFEMSSEDFTKALNDKGVKLERKATEKNISAEIIEYDYIRTSFCRTDKYSIDGSETLLSVVTDIVNGDLIKIGYSLDSFNELDKDMDSIVETLSLCMTILNESRGDNQERWKEAIRKGTKDAKEGSMVSYPDVNSSLIIGDTDDGPYLIVQNKGCPTSAFHAMSCHSYWPQ